MVHIQENSEDISSVIGVRTEDHGSGQIWDDGPDNIIENAQGNPNPSGFGRIAQGRHIK